MLIKDQDPRSTKSYRSELKDTGRHKFWKFQLK